MGLYKSIIREVRRLQQEDQEFEASLSYIRPCLKPGVVANIFNPSFQVWWQISLIPAFRGQRQVDLYEIKASPVYIVSSSHLRLQGDSVS